MHTIEEEREPETREKNLQAQRIDRLKDYISLFKLTPEKAQQLDSVVAGQEYRTERGFNTKINRKNKDLTRADLSLCAMRKHDTQI